MTAQYGTVVQAFNGSIESDVQGHALAVRVAGSNSVAAFRRGLIAGALAASLALAAAAGAVALSHTASSVSLGAPAAPVAAPVHGAQNPGTDQQPVRNPRFGRPIAE